MQRVAACLPRCKVAIHSGDRCISGCYWRSIDARSGRWPSTSGLHESSIEAYRIEVFGLWKGVGGSCILLHPVAALFRVLSRRSHGDNRSSTLDPPDGAASLVPDAVEVGTTGVIPINQSQVQVPTEQGKYCRQCIEQEQTAPDRRPEHQPSHSERSWWRPSSRNDSPNIQYPAVYGGVTVHRGSPKDWWGAARDVQPERRAVAEEEIQNIPSRGFVPCRRWSMVDGGAQGPAAEDHLGKPRCPK